MNKLIWLVRRRIALWAPWLSPVRRLWVAGLPPIAGAAPHSSPLDRMKLAQVVNPAVNASGSVTSGEIDMQGWNGCIFMVPVGALDGTLDLKIMSSTTSGGTLTTITGAAITQFTAGQDNHMAAIDIYRPTNRYLKVVLANTGTTGANAGVIAMQYDPTGLTPVTQPATVSEVVRKIEN